LACFEDLYDGVVGCAVEIGCAGGAVGSVIAVFGHVCWICGVYCQVYNITINKDLNETKGGL
jgi:hypothetical protein